MIPAVFLVPTNCSMVILKGPRHPKRTPMVCLKMMGFSNGSCGYCGIETSRSLVTGVCWVPSVIRHAHIDGGAGVGNRVLSFSIPLDDINDQRRLFPTKDLIQSFAQNHDNLYSLEQTIQVENAWCYWHGQVESRKFWNFDPIFDLICVPFVLGGWGENL